MLGHETPPQLGIVIVRPEQRDEPLHIPHEDLGLDVPTLLSRVRQHFHLKGPIKLHDGDRFLRNGKRTEAATFSQNISKRRKIEK